MSAKLKQFDKPWDQGFANGTFATVACPAWMLGYIKEKSGDPRQGQVGRGARPRPRPTGAAPSSAVPEAGKHKKEATSWPRG